MATKLTKVNRIGDACYHVFINDLDGSEVIIPITKEEYTSLETQNIQPKKKGHTWWYSLETPLYDTPSGRLEVGQYADLNTDEISAKPQSSRAFYDLITKNTEVVDGFLSIQAEAEFNSIFGPAPQIL